MMQRCFRIALAAFIACGASFAAEQTWTGRISTGMCAKAHMDNKCIQNCVKAGEKYVFVSNGKVRGIQNQDFGDLEKHAGHTVKLSGTLSSDLTTITVTKIEMRVQGKHPKP